MIKNGIIIQGSSRSHGDTRKISEFIISSSPEPLEFIDLLNFEINHYDYNHRHQGDDFFKIIEKLLKYDSWIFITPVYWYSMSGVMKVFLDRFTDLLKVRKNYGRQLKGKNLAMVSCSNDKDRTSGFELPFINTAAYLEMNFSGEIHTWVSDGEISEESRQLIQKFISDFQDTAGTT